MTLAILTPMVLAYIAMIESTAFFIRCVRSKKNFGGILLAIICFILSLYAMYSWALGIISDYAMIGIVSALGIGIIVFNVSIIRDQRFKENGGLSVFVLRKLLLWLIPLGAIIIMGYFYFGV